MPEPPRCRNRKRPEMKVDGPLQGFRMITTRARQVRSKRTLKEASHHACIGFRWALFFGDLMLLTSACATSEEWADVERPQHPLRLGHPRGLLAAEQPRRLEPAGEPRGHRRGSPGELVGQGHHGEPRARSSRTSRSHDGSGTDPRLLGGLLLTAALVVSGGAESRRSGRRPHPPRAVHHAQGQAPGVYPPDAAPPVLGADLQLPALAGRPSGRASASRALAIAQDDDRYLSTWIYVDQREDAAFAALPQERRVSAMFSRYGVDMLTAHVDPGGRGGRQRRDRASRSCSPGSSRARGGPGARR